MSNIAEKITSLFNWIYKDAPSNVLEFLLLNNDISESHRYELIKLLPVDNLELIKECLNHKEEYDDIYVRLKEYLIIEVDFKIDSLESIDSSYYETLETYGRIQPTWQNIICFYNEIIDLPLNILNKYYQILVSEDVPDRIRDDHELFILQNDDLELDAYSAYIEKLDIEPFTLSSTLSWDKVAFLYEKKFLRINDETITQFFNQLDEKGSNHQFIIDILDQNIDQVVSGNLDDWLWRLDGGNEGLAFVRNIFSFECSIKLKTEIFIWLLRRFNNDNEHWVFNEDLPISKKILLEITKNINDDELRVRLINEYFLIITSKKQDIRHFFSTFENDEFKKLSTDDHRFKPKIEDNEINRELYDKLFQIDIVDGLEQEELEKGILCFRNKKITMSDQNDNDYVD